MRVHHIGVSPTLATPAFRDFELRVIQGGPWERRWHRTPVRSLERGPGSWRFEGTGAVWGRSLAEVQPLIRAVPDPVCIVVCPVPQPTTGAGSAPRIVWLPPNEVSRVIVKHWVGVHEIVIR